MTTKAGLIQNIKWNIKPEYHIPYFHIDIIVNMFIDEIKKAILGRQKIVIHGLMKFDTKIVDEKTGIFLGRSYHCKEKMMGTVKLSESFQKIIRDNLDVI